MKDVATATTRAGETGKGPERIVEPGRNCWGVEHADRFSCIQDASDYFRLVRLALLSAHETAFILGWDITAHTDLLPDGGATDAPSRLDRLLAFIAKRRPHLRCYILIWDYGSLYTLERDPLSRWRLGWRMPHGVRFGFDDRHPVGGSHHQKIVVVDDQLAFCGGIDLTGHRWDTCAHRPEEPARVTPVGKKYGPYHEVQAMVSGAAAARLGALARDRWRALGVDRLPRLQQSSDDRWPEDVTADLTGVDVAIARTMPATEASESIRECEALFLDSIRLARRAIYIESQYFTSDTVAAALGERLQERDGPEVIVVTPQECHGWLEKSTMGAFRDSVFRRLIAADTHKRLRIVYPVASRSQGVPTFVHSKVMVVDDALVRIGSANISQRSMGVDSECDLAVDAAGDRGVRDGIRRIRDRLLAEHLGVPAETVAREVERAGSLCALIDAHAGGDHTLVRIEMPPEPIPPSPVLRAAADPDETVAFRSSVEFLVPGGDPISGGSPRRLWVMPAIVLAAAVVTAIVWSTSQPDGWALVHAAQETLRALPAARASIWIGAGVLLLAAMLLVPLEILAIGAGLLIGFRHGTLAALVGSAGAAVIGYAAGRVIGPAGLVRWMSRRSYRSGRQLGARGVGGVIALRLAAVASAGSVHLLCGAARIPVVTYLTGSALALVPAIVALSGLGALIRRALLQPSVSHVLLTVGALVIIGAAALAARAYVLIRQLAPSMSGHRDRAEYG